MALDTLAKQLHQAIGNVTKLRDALVTQSQTIAKERETNATKQTLDQQLLPNKPSGH